MHTLQVRGEGRCSRGRKETLEDQTATKQLLDCSLLFIAGLAGSSAWCLQTGSTSLSSSLSSSASPFPRSRLRIYSHFAYRFCIHPSSSPVVDNQYIFLFHFYLAFHGLLLICLRASICMKAWIQPTDKSIYSSVPSLQSKNRININVAREKLQLY